MALGTLACAGRRERREERLQQRELEREARLERLERLERQRAEREQRYVQQQPQRAEVRPRVVEEPVEGPAPKPAAVVAPVVVPEATARLVFFRPSKQSSKVDAALFDVTGPGEPKFIGTVTPASKFTYPLRPGLYTFMAVGETAEFMQASINSGRTYYALVIPKSGAKRFAIEPVRQHEIGGKDFITWDQGTRQMSDAGKPHDAADAARKRVKYWQDGWMKKSDAQRAELTINAGDGR